MFNQECLQMFKDLLENEIDECPERFNMMLKQHAGSLVLLNSICQGSECGRSS